MVFIKGSVNKMHPTTKILAWFGWKGGYQMLVNMIVDLYGEFDDLREDVGHELRRRQRLEK